MNEIVKGISEILGKLTQDQKNHLVILNDPMTRKIMAKLASKHSPITSNDIPLDKLGIKNEVSVLSRLSFLEKNGLATSTNVQSNGKHAKRYTLNSKGMALVDSEMKREKTFFK